MRIGNVEIYWIWPPRISIWPRCGEGCIILELVFWQIEILRGNCANSKADDDV